MHKSASNVLISGRKDPLNWQRNLRREKCASPSVKTSDPSGRCCCSCTRWLKEVLPTPAWLQGSKLIMTSSSARWRIRGGPTEKNSHALCTNCTYTHSTDGRVCTGCAWPLKRKITYKGNDSGKNCKERVIVGRRPISYTDRKMEVLLFRV